MNPYLSDEVLESVSTQLQALSVFHSPNSPMLQICESQVALHAKACLWCMYDYHSLHSQVFHDGTNGTNSADEHMIPT